MILTVKRGFFLYDEEQGCYRLYGKNVNICTQRLDKGCFMTGFLDRFRLESADPLGKVITTVRKLESERVQMTEGEERYIYIAGSAFKAIKDSTIIICNNVIIIIVSN